ncbi:hypothetical protein F5Y18DRAFT_437807 [Xylariaceae sp. FL1019]|nr:hypothetical protein F5Y18DRAFT_437807 [Xylariaceae sp. FL1019]
MSQTQIEEVTLTSFERFMHLPPVLRYMIWDYCMPSRPVDVLWTTRLARSRQVLRIEQINGPAGVQIIYAEARPLISQVCLEAWDYVLRTGGLKVMNQNGDKMWFDDRFDWIHLNPESFGSLLRWLPPDSPSIQILDLPQDIQMRLNSRNAPISVNLPVNTSHFVRASMSRTNWALQCITGRVKCDVVLYQIELDLHYQDACDCGLFGLFAESSPAFVDLNDPAQIEKLGAALQITEATPVFDLLDYKGAFLRTCNDSEQVQVSIDRFAKWIVECWISEYGEAELPTMPRFNFVVQVRLARRRVVNPRNDSRRKRQTVGSGMKKKRRSEE